MAKTSVYLNKGPGLSCKKNKMNKQSNAVSAQEVLQFIFLFAIVISLAILLGPLLTPHFFWQLSNSVLRTF